MKSADAHTLPETSRPCAGASGSRTRRLQIRVNVDEAMGPLFQRLNEVHGRHRGRELVMFARLGLLALTGLPQIAELSAARRDRDADRPEVQPTVDASLLLPRAGTILPCRFQIRVP